MNANDFVRIDLPTYEGQPCGHGSHTGNACQHDAVARVVPVNAQWFKRYRCEAHANDYMDTPHNARDANA